MKKSHALILGCAVMIAAGAGCSSKPSSDELKQLNDLNAEVSSLEKEIAARESDKAALIKGIADKDAQLTQCAKDRDALQQRLKGM